MIEIITEKVEMPEPNKRKFQIEHENNKWVVIDSETDTIRFKGKFQDVSLSCLHLNKKHYLFFLCKDCGKDCGIDDKDYYMVKHEIWQRHGVGERMLCMDCMENRLGHKLTASDLLDCPLNTFNEYTLAILNRC